MTVLSKSLKIEAKALDNSLKFPEGTDPSVIFATQNHYQRRRSELEQIARAIDPFRRVVGARTVEVAL